MTTGALDVARISQNATDFSHVCSASRSYFPPGDVQDVSSGAKVMQVYTGRPLQAGYG